MIVNTLGATYIVLAVGLCWRTYTIGFYNTQEFSAMVFTNEFFVIIKVQVFVLIATLTFELHLVT